ncbi:MAG: phosphodiester glycosidase family protein [Nocardiopsis sp. BM-2018]|nr:MAG: phosphodiester glycosidase family protein [Nocardiopsis sp. BM-2018]
MPTRPWPVLVVALVLAAGAFVAAQADLAASTPMVRIPGTVATVNEGAIVLSAAGRELVYVEGFGWLHDLDAPPPDVIDGVVYGAPELLAALALDLPVVEAVRFAGDAQVRMVIDVPALDARALAGIERRGQVGAGESLRLALPALLVPSGLDEAYAGLEVVLRAGSDSTELEVSGGAFSYEVFALATPTRIVLDLALERPRLGPDTVEALAEGVTYRRVRAEGAGGPTWVHVLEVAPGVGEWRVVGALGEVRTTDRWASGAFAAINGGYFDTGTRQVIGMLVVDGTMLSLPSRNRAVIAFGDGPPLIDRVRATYSVWLDGVPVAVRGAPYVDQIAVVKGPGWAGSGRFGVLVVDQESDRVVDNRVGPVRITADQIALVYPAELRPLALAEGGAHVRYSWHIEPEAIGAARYAVEAGPLLLKDGRNALQPELEQFAVGQRILDGLTQQAAIGVRADGSVVLVAAEAMVAADLVPLLLELGARDALRLDSGGSTTLYADGRVFNRRSEREVVNAIVLRMP